MAHCKEDSVDVIIVGSGGSTPAAALESCRAGARVAFILINEIKNRGKAR